MENDLEVPMVTEWNQRESSPKGMKFQICPGGFKTMRKNRVQGKLKYLWQVLKQRVWLCDWGEFH